MAGHVSGVQTRIREKYPRALYVHCAAHLLNLAVNDQNKVCEIRRTCDIVRKIIEYFKDSSNRRQLLEDTSIPSYCPTRWTEKYKAMRVFKKSYHKFLDGLDQLAEANEDAAFGLKTVLEKHTIIYCICLIARISSYLEPLALALQERGLLVTKVKRMVDTIKELLLEERNSDALITDLYEEACEMAEVDEL